MKKTSFTFAKTFQWQRLSNPFSAVITVCLLLIGNFAFGQIMDPCPLGSGNTVSGCPAPGPHTVFADASCNAVIPDYRGGVSGTAGAGFAYIGPVQVPFAGTIVNGAGNYPVQVGAGFVDLASMTLCAELCTDLTVTVADNLPPNISCAAPLTIDVDANCEVVISDAADALQFVPSLTDNCTPLANITIRLDTDGNLATIENYPYTFAGPTCPGPNPRPYNISVIATDGAGNSSSCASGFGVRDNAGPSATCNNGSPIDVYVDATCIGTIPNLTGLPTGIVDNCNGPVTFGQSPAPGTVFGLPCSGYDQPVGVTITDCFGNFTVCEYSVVFNDTIRPTINTACGSLPPQPTLVADASCMVTIPDLRPLISASDNCDPGPLAITQTPAPGPYDVSGICPPNNTITVTFEASDCHGNDATPLVCSSLLTFTDNTAPTIVCPPTPVPVVVPFDNLTCEHGTAMVDLATLIAGGVTVADNCDPNPTLVSVDPNMFMCADIGKAGLTVTINAQDCFGNPGSGVCPIDVQPDIDLTAEWAIPGGDFIVCPSEFPVPIVLGPNTPACGTWSGDVLVTSSNTFTGGFDVSNWTIDLAGSATAEVNTAAAPSSIYMVSSNDGFGPPHVTSFSIVVPVSGDYSFNWNYSSANSSPMYDPFGYSVNGVFTQLTDDAGSLQQNGTVTVSLNAGETFAFEARSIDQCCGAATTTISPIISLDAASFPDLDNDGVPDPGAYSLTYTVGAPGCHVEETHNIMVSPQFNAGDAALVDDFSICLEATEVFDLEGLLDTNSVQGGTFTTAGSGTLSGSQIGNLWQYLGGDGQLTVIYTLTDCDNDLEQDTVVISIDEKPDGHFTLPANFCQDEGSAFAIITGVPSGATVAFSSIPSGYITDASTGLFDPTAGPLFGEFADVFVTMQVTNGVCDTFNVSQWVVVYASGDPAFVIPDTICESAAPLNLVLTNPLNDGGVNALLPGNVTWTGTGVTDLGTTGAFDPQDLAPGYYTICVTVGAPSCEETLCQDIFVAQDYTPAEVALIDDFSLCLFPDDVIDFGSLLAAGALPGGTFVATEQGGLNGNGTINPNSYVYNGECGTLQVVHYFPDDCVPNSDTIVITIEQKPDVGGLAIPGPLCAQDPVAFIEYSGTPVVCGVAGVFSAPLSPAGTITDLGTGTTAVFDPVAAGEGLHIIQYEIGNPVSGCYAILFAEIEVKASSDPDFTVNNVVCANEVVNLALDNADPSVLPTSPDGNTEIAWLGGDGVNAVVTDNGDGTGTFVGYKSGTYTVCVLTGDVGCMAFQCQNITVDVTPPVMNCGPLVRTRNNDLGVCTFTMPGTGFDVTATDNCVPPNGASSLVLTHNYAPYVGTNPNSLMGATFPVGITQVVWTATDTAGNSSNCTIQIEILDAEAPLVQAGGCPANIVQGTDADICGANVTYDIPQFSDNCDGVDLEGVLVSGYAPGTDFPVGVTTVTWIYTDLADNGTATCSFTVTINDDDDPTPVCSPAYAVSLDGDGEFDILATDIDNGSYDNCDVVSTLISRTGGPTWSGSISVSCADVLVSPVVITLQVIDQAGNSSTCTTEVTVNDDQTPDIECSGNLTVHADPNVCAAVVTYPAPLVVDNCSYTIDQIDGTGLTSGSTFPVGTTIQTYKVTDIAGNMDTCSFTVFVYDEIAPTVDCGPGVYNRTADPGVCSYTVQGTEFDAVGADNCAGVTITHNYPFAANPNSLAGSSFPVGSTTVTWIATDVSGNQSAICGIEIVVTDDEDPTINCNAGAPANVLMNPSFEAGGPFDSQITDNWVNFGPAFRLFASVSPAFFTHDGNVMLKTFGGAGGVYQDFPVTVGDQLNGSAWIRNASFDPIGANQFAVVKFEFLDAANNIISFVESPQFNSGNLPVDVWTEATVSTTVPAGTVNARFVVVSVTLSGGGAVMFDDASVTIGSGGSSGNVTVSNDPGECGANLVINNPMADDNCGIVSIINDYNNTTNASDFYPVGTTVVVFTVTDASGNTATCSITVEVTDDEDPEFVNCPTTMVMVGNDPDECSGKINWSIPVATDNCDIDTIVQTGGPMSGTVVPVGMPQTVTYTATDIYGNTNTCVFEVQVVDTQDPDFDADIVMPTDITVECNAIPDNCVFHGNGICTPLTNNDVNDNCTAPANLVITFTETSTQGTDPNNCNFYNYTLTRTWTVTDEAGNSTTHVQVITVQDTTPPVPSCQNATVTLDKSGVGTIDPSMLIAGTTDNCAPFNVLDVTASQTSFDCSDLGANNVTLTISDPCLNQATCTIVVTVEEGIAPCTPEATMASSCLNNATTLTNGQFAELITVKSLAMQTWTVASSIGLYTNASPAPPASPINVPVGTALVMGTADGIDNDGDGAMDEADEMIYYTLNAKYIEAIGYNATLTNNLGQTLAISNVAHYPTPVLANFFDPFCLSTPAFVPEVVDQFAGAGAYVSITFELDGQPVTQIDPSTLSIGQHTLVITVDAGTAAFSRRVNGVLVPGDAASSNEARLDPGCVQSITEIFNIVTTPTQVVCNDLVQVTLEDDCSSVITPDMVLEGTYSCFDDYEVHITLPNGLPLNPPNVVTGAHAGLTLPYTLWHPISGNTCWGSIAVEDKTDPEVTCPAPADIWCTVDPDSIVFYLPPSHPKFPAKDYFGKLVPFNGSLLYLGEPTVTDCSDWSWEYTDEYQVFDCAQNANIAVLITRTFVVTDEWGNSDTCHQTITKFRGEASHVVFPADKDIDCDNPILATLAPDFDPAVCGWPQISGIDITTTGTGICGLGVTYTDEIVNLCPGSYKVVRTWKIYDWCPAGGGAPTQTTHIQYIKVVDKAPQITLPCLQTIDTFHVVHTLGSIYNLNGNNVIVTPTTFFVGQIVETTADYFDEVIDVILIAPSVKVKIERNWTSLGFCSLNASIPGNQPHYPCSTQGPVPLAIIDGGCNALVEVTVETPAGFTTNGGIIPGDGLPLGLHEIIYRAEDECGNITQVVLPILVEDLTAPVAVCDEITDVNLSADGLAEVFAETFDDGSYDGCCLEDLLVRKMVDNCADGHDDTVFGPSIYFCCEDIDNSPITVVFRAVDCFGNYNDCMVQVHVNDKLNPYLVECPANERITCDWYADNLETQLALLSGNAQAQSEFLNDHFGQPTFEDNCDIEINYQINIALDQCLEGAITRNWTAVDPSGNQSQACNQTIFVDHVSDWVVEFPADITVTCGTGVPDFGEPEIFFETCELVGVSYEDEVFTTVPDACYKLLRTWTIINWCVVGTEIDEEVVESSERAFQLAFPLEPCDFDGDGDCDTRTFRDSWRVNPKSKPSAIQATQTTNPDTDLDSDPWDGYITYQQTIKVVDNVDPVFTNGCVIPDVCIEDNTCNAVVVLPEPEITECSPEVTFNVTSDLGTGFGPFSNVAPGTYNVTYNVIDNCNNQTDCHTTVTVKDCKKPTPYCKNGLVIELMVGGAMNGTVELWASDFDAGSFDNCTDQDDLVLSFSANTNNNNAVFTCDDLGQQVIQLWVTDEAGNQDYCETFVVIQANMNQCDDPSNPLVAGSIQTEELESVADVNVQLSGSAQQSMMTGNDGMFNFSVTPGDDYTVTPVKDDEPLNGVTTLDLVYITKHILGIQLLDSPYKLIAADANKSNSVTTFDLVQLRKLILFIDPTFPNNTSWRFVDKDYVFPDPANPWSETFPEVININNIAASQLAADFVAIKVGDVNSSAVTNFASAGDDRNAVGSLVFAIDNVQLTAGEEYTVDFKARDFDVLGYQFTLNFDRTALEFVQVNSAVAGSENFGLTMLENGAITTSWNDNDTRLADNEVVFSLVFKATANVRLSEALSANSRYTAAEAYKRNGDLLDVELVFNGSQVAGNFELYQNTPNPFSTSTVIGFNLPQASAATLTITDVSGKVVKVLNGDFAKGYNEFKLERRELPATGILYYQLDTQSDSATKMMLLMD